MEKTKGFLQEFKEFAYSGNLLDIAVALIMATAIGKVVGSLVSDIIMPPIGQLLGGVSFSDLSVKLGDGANAATLNYGNFLQSLIDFTIIAFVVFCLVRVVNNMKKDAGQKDAPSQEDLLGEIRDILKKK
jgi:large conductance mechanosensitive channel